jgi:hypothetical protein
MFIPVHGSGFFPSRIPDPEIKKAPYQGSGSATPAGTMDFLFVQRCTMNGNITFLKYDLEFYCNYNVKLIVLTNNIKSSTNLYSLYNASNQQINSRKPTRNFNSWMLKCKVLRKFTEKKKSTIRPWNDGNMSNDNVNVF